MEIKTTLQIKSNIKSIPNFTEISKWIKLTCYQHSNNADITIRIIDTKEMISINTKYRNKKIATNILSFNLNTPNKNRSKIIGDLIVCASTIEKESKEQNKKTLNHWAHIIIHGTLHLLGFTHNKKKDTNKMQTLEIKLLNKLNIFNPYLNK